MNADFGFAERMCADALIDLAIAEDVGTGDITAEALFPADHLGSCVFVSRSPGVIAGLPVLAMLAERFGLIDGWSPILADGDRVEPGSRIAAIAGPTRSILAMERTALNFVQRLSGVASLTARFVAEVAGTRAKILDTRKTTPGWRSLEKYAVRCGGGHNHRMGLFDAILIKDNHIAALADPFHRRDRNAPFDSALALARDAPNKGKFVEIEVDSLDQFDRVLLFGADIVLLDNLGPADVAEAVRRRDAFAPTILLESSGGITLTTVRPLAETGVDRISVGAITHSAPSLDIGLDS